MKYLVFFWAILGTLVICAEQPKYVFLFIGDGMSAPQRQVAEDFSKAVGRGDLVMNTLPVKGSATSSSANALITDSAAAATAIACGVKTNNGMLGLDPKGNRLVSSAEVAKASGKKVGIVSNVTITHATPAGFYAHRGSRGDVYGIATDLIRSQFDFFAGGGLGDYKNSHHPEFAQFGHVYHYAETNGYKVVRSRKEFLSLKPADGKVLTRFTDGYLAKAIDPRPENQPSLAEITAKAIEMLDNENGFFVMIEGGLVDWAGHANDAAANLREILALDDAIKVAMDFMRQHPEETLIVATGDHETGGLTMGFAGTGHAVHPERLAGQTMSSDEFHYSVERLFKRNPNTTFEDVSVAASKAYGFRFEGNAENDPMVLTKEEVAVLRSAYDHDVIFHKAKIEENTKYDGEKRYLFGGACRRVLAAKCGLVWGSGYHTAAPVLTTAIGPGSDKFNGAYDNTAIAERIKELVRK